VNETNKIVTDPESAEILAFRVLGWVLEDGARAQRLLGLTGLDPRTLRDGLEDPAMLAAILGFLASHEPDLLACAASLNIAPTELMAASRYFGGTQEN
jgi:hypothetical protein